MQRLEVGGEGQLSAIVEDEETKPEDLVYEWSAARAPSGPPPTSAIPAASAGTFIGSGARVRWVAPRGEPTPADFRLTLTVVERYTVTSPDGTTEAKENRATASTSVDVNDSPKDVADLVLAFLKDFSDSTVSAEQCVRHFNDHCARGKAEELEDIRENRARYVILSSRYRIDNLTINSAFDVAEIKAPCEFTSRVIRTGRIEVARGDCNFVAVYGPRRWGLCDSRFAGAALGGLTFLR